MPCGIGVGERHTVYHCLASLYLAAVDLRLEEAELYEVEQSVDLVLDGLRAGFRERRHRELYSLQLREFFRLHTERLFEFGDAMIVPLDLLALHQP